MKDGRTRKIKRQEEAAVLDPFLATHRASLVVENGPAAGEEFMLATKQVVVGRGPAVDVNFNDDAMSREHVAFELGSEGFRARDLASTNGMRINGSETLVANLEHGDAIQIGNAVFRYIVEPIPKSAKTHVIGN